MTHQFKVSCAIQIKALYKNIAGQLPGILFGLLISFVIWIPSYFGFIEIGLPQRYSYEVIDHQIIQALPAKYNIYILPK